MRNEGMKNRAPKLGNSLRLCVCVIWTSYRYEMSLIWKAQNASTQFSRSVWMMVDIRWGYWALQTQWNNLLAFRCHRHNAPVRNNISSKKASTDARNYFVSRIVCFCSTRIEMWTPSIKPRSSFRPFMNTLFSSVSDLDLCHTETNMAIGCWKIELDCQQFRVAAADIPESQDRRRPLCILITCGGDD